MGGEQQIPVRFLKEGRKENERGEDGMQEDEMRKKET